VTLAVAAVFASCVSDQASPTTIDLGRGETPPIVAVAPSASSATGGVGGIAWRTDGDEARQRAQRSRRPLLVFVSAAWDVSSKRIEDEELADPRVVAAARGAVALRVDVTDVDGPHDVLLDKLGVKSVPTVLVLAPNERVLYRSEKGPVSVDALLDALGAP
jgi:thiol:disulfide interchange protein